MAFPGEIFLNRTISNLSDTQTGKKSLTATVVHIQPLFVKTTTWYFILLLVAFLVIFIIYTLVIRYRQGEKLRILVDKRTKELQESIDKFQVVNDELQRSRDAYQSLFDQNPYAVFSFDLAGNFLSANQKTSELTGYPIDQLLKMSFVPLIPSKDIDVILMHFVNAGKGTNQNYQTEIITASGKYLYVDVTNLPIYINDEITGIYGIVKDITEEKLLSDALMISNERFLMANKATSDCIWDWDLRTNKVERTGKCIEMFFGYDKQDPENVDDFWNRLAHSKDWDRVNRKRQAIFNNPEQDYWEDEYRFLTASGEYGFICDRGYIIRDSQGKAIRMIGAAKDITRRKLEEHQLKLMESVITHTTDAVIISKAVENDIKIVYANDAFTRMTGYAMEEIVGESSPILRGDDTDSEDLERFRVAQANWQPYKTETLNYKKNGDPFWIDVNMMPVADKDGNFTHYISIERDITERKKHVKAIEDQNLKLREISWIQSHIVRAPLTRMIGLINLIEEGSIPEAMLSELLFHIKSSGLEIDLIIRDIVKKSELVNNDLLIEEEVTSQ